MLYVTVWSLLLKNKDFSNWWFVKCGFETSYYIYGAGEIGRECIDLLDAAGVEIRGILDRRFGIEIEKSGRLYKTIAINQLNEKGNIIIASGNYEKEIEKELVLFYPSKLKRLHLYSEIKNALLRDYYLYCLENKMYLNDYMNAYERMVNQTLCFTGKYDTWELAKEDTIGYDDNDILSKVLTATLNTKNDDSKYERDGVVFEGNQWNHQVLASFMYVITKEKRPDISVIDFGGALGSTRFQHSFLSAMNWNIIEQHHFVEVGKNEIKEISFWESMDDYELAGNKADVLYLSSVLMYLDDPYTFLERVVDRGIKYILIDRTYYSDGDDIIVIENIPKSIYESSYPAHLLSKERIYNIIGKRYSTITTWFSTMENEIIESMPYYGDGNILNVNGQGSLFELNE